LSFIIIGHPEWQGCSIRVFDLVEEGSGDNSSRLDELIISGRLPISPTNVQKVFKGNNETIAEKVASVSCDADLLVLGLSLKKMRKDGGKYMMSFPCAQDILFVRAGQTILIDSDAEVEDFTEGIEDGNLVENWDKAHSVMANDTGSSPDSSSQTEKT